MTRALPLLVVLACSVSCITTVNPVQYSRAVGAPELPERPEGCAVEFFDEGDGPKRPHKVLGRLELLWTANQMKEQGQEYAMKTLRTAVCEYGGHFLINMRALPRGFNEGMLFEGDVAVIVDEAGEPLVGTSTGTATSQEGGVPADAPAPAPATPLPATP